MVQELPGKVSRNSGNWMRTIQPKILEIPRAKWMERNLPGKKIFENLGIPREVVLCLRNLWKHCSIHFCRKFRLEVRVEWKAPIIFFSAFTGTTKIFCSICLDNLQAASWENAKYYRYFVNYTNQSNFCFQCEKQCLFTVWNFPYGETVLPFQMSCFFQKFSKKSVTFTFPWDFPEIFWKMVNSQCQYHLPANFHRNFPTNGKRFCRVPGRNANSCSIS